jgi:hypothetical protein
VHSNGQEAKDPGEAEEKAARSPPLTSRSPPLTPVASFDDVRAAKGPSYVSAATIRRDIMKALFIARSAGGAKVVVRSAELPHGSNGFAVLDALIEEGHVAARSGGYVLLSAHPPSVSPPLRHSPTRSELPSDAFVRLLDGPDPSAFLLSPPAADFSGSPFKLTRVRSSQPSDDSDEESVFDIMGL